MAISDASTRRMQPHSQIRHRRIGRRTRTGKPASTQRGATRRPGGAEARPPAIGTFTLRVCLAVCHCLLLPPGLRRLAALPCSPEGKRAKVRHAALGSCLPVRNSSGLCPAPLCPACPPARTPAYADHHQPPPVTTRLTHPVAPRLTLLLYHRLGPVPNPQSSSSPPFVVIAIVILNTITTGTAHLCTHTRHTCAPIHRPFFALTLAKKQSFTTRRVHPYYSIHPLPSRPSPLSSG